MFTVWFYMKLALRCEYRPLRLYVLSWRLAVRQKMG